LDENLGQYIGGEGEFEGDREPSPRFLAAVRSDSITRLKSSGGENAKQKTIGGPTVTGPIRAKRLTKQIDFGVIRTGNPQQELIQESTGLRERIRWEERL
jgi:hypothetical protein